MIDFSIILAGFGGQGILSAGKMAAEAALYEGKEVSWFPSYGPEMRGGTANCSVVISDEPIGSPVVNDADVVICLNQPSMEKFEPCIKPGGVLIIDSSLIRIKPTRTDIKFIPMNASEIASELGKLIGRVNAAGARTDHDDVEVFALFGIRKMLLHCLLYLPRFFALNII